MGADAATTTPHVVLPHNRRGTLHSTILRRPSPFSSETCELAMGEFDPSTAASVLSSAKVLVIGAGGLGCETLKDLALSGIKDVHVVDMDTIDVTNLNRQFLFRMADVGSSKAEVAAKFIRARCPSVIVTPHHGKIQDFDKSFYRQFNLIVSGLDNIDARRWLNSLVVGLAEVDEDGFPDPDTMIPVVDGGTEGLAGQSRVILPRMTSCYECALDSFPPARGFPMCTIAQTPRMPEHCVSYAMMVQWPKARPFSGAALDGDSPEHMKWVHKKAAERAAFFNIPGVTYSLTLGVVKNIIPAVASTNAIVSASCALEAVKMLSFCSQTLDNWMSYAGAEGLYSRTFSYGRKDDCPVCQSPRRTVTVDPASTLKEMIAGLKEGDLRLKDPSIVGQITLYMRAPASLEAATRPNLAERMDKLVIDGEELTVTDPTYAGETTLALIVCFK